MQRSEGRNLILFPVLHTEADLGKLAGPVREDHIRKLGQENWEQGRSAVRRLWEEMRSTVEQMDLDWPRVRLYQDGLPVCGHEIEIVTDLARGGSPNHELLLELVKRGAKLMGTESAELVVEEYRFAREILSATDGPGTDPVEGERAAKSRALLEKRDRFIASRIGETLKEGETGIVFIGLLHSLTPWLPPDIRVERVFRKE